MPRITLSLTANAPIHLCFDLARSIDFHVESLRHTGETAIAGRTSGLIELGEEVTWRANHFIKQELTARITIYDRPNYFRDSMVRGAFRRFDHDHYFERLHEQQTRMTDVFDFDSPFGWLGELANQAFLTRYMTDLLEKRNCIFLQTVESPQLRAAFLNSETVA